MYPMLDGGPLFRPRDVLVVLRRLRRHLIPKAYEQSVDYSEGTSDKMIPFDEYSACICGSDKSHEVLIARDGNRVVECEACGLWRTCPRPKREAWEAFLSAEDEARNIEVTERRLTYGVAWARNIPLSPSFWWRARRYQARRRVKHLVAAHGGRRPHIHDVGCGAGYFVKSCVEMGYPASGNDLNRYAVSRLREIFGLEVHHGTLRSLLSRLPKVDIVSSREMIEHVYNPLEEIRAAYELLKPSGILSVQTFAIDSDVYRRVGKDWSNFTWNHTYHFSSRTLSDVVSKAGFEVERASVSGPSVEVIGRKG